MTTIRGGRVRRATLGAALLGASLGCATRDADDRASAADSAFGAVQERGRAAMGVDQYTSAHVFEDLPDGGRVVLDREVDDSAGVATIRAHMRDIAAAFARGDFATPGFVHARAAVPGTAVMAAKRDAITYTAADRPRGGELRIASSDPAAVRAIHEFLAFQRTDHRAAGHEGMTHGAAAAPDSGAHR
jgi:hypothetical protein